MKTKISLLFAILLSVFFIMPSCSDSKADDSKPGAKDTDNQSINDWIYDEMSEKYFWNDELPKSTSLNFSKTPDAFFYSLLYKYKVGGDRFSFLENDGIPKFSDQLTSKNKKRNTELGFEYYRIPMLEGGHVFCVVYVMNGSKAAAGENPIERGDIIYQVNGQRITDSNYHSILYTGASEFNLTLVDGTKKTVAVSSNYYEDPVHYSNVISVGENTKIGYIVYNFFANDKEDDSMEYALEMNNILKSFEGAGIDELVLDLRYNGGGLVQSGTFIASAIAPNRSGNIYTKRRYNSTLESMASYKSTKNNFFEDDIIAGRTKHAIPKLNMKRIFVLTSEYTASASEQIINGLRVYLDVEIIGWTTTGKNMESIPISDKSNKSNKWVLYPLTSISFNSKDEFEYNEGFAPTFGDYNSSTDGKDMHEFGDKLDQGSLYPFGDKREILLAKAIEAITGVKAKATTPRSVGQSPFGKISIEGSSLERKSREMIIDIKE